MSKKNDTKLDTRVIHAGAYLDPMTGSVMPPIYATSTYIQEEPGKNKGYFYGRMQNPTRAALENALADLESGKRAFAFSSGMAAEAAILDLLPVNSHIIAMTDLYGGTIGLFERIRAQTSGLTVTYLDLNDWNEAASSIKPNTKMIWVESPTNPLLRIADLKGAADFAKKHNLTSVVDSTFAGPILQRPLELGIDIVMHSTTKYLNGHSDVIGGAVIVGDNPDLAQRLSFLHETVGAIAGPFESFLVLRGIKTLALRTERHCSNAMAIARYLENHPRILRVIYPGLESHPQHDLARQQMQGFGGMITIELNGGLDDVRRMTARLKIFALAVSLGGVESLINHPALMTHASVPVEQRLSRGITDGLLRLSVGIENADDLIADLSHALGF